MIICEKHGMIVNNIWIFLDIKDAYCILQFLEKKNENSCSSMLGSIRVN
jgi:hypothetical protein